MAGPRGAIKIGTGYISIEPHLDRRALGQMRSTLTREMGAIGREAGRAFGAGASRGFTGMSKAALAEAKATSRALTRQAAQGVRERGTVHADEAHRYARVEQELTRTHGAQVAVRARQALAASEARSKGHSTEATRALRLHQQTLDSMARADRELDNEQRRLAAGRRRSLEDSARMDREIHRTQVRMERDRQTQIAEAARQQRQAQADAQRMGRLHHQAERQMLTDMVQARKAALRHELADVQLRGKAIRDSIAAYRRDLQQLNASTTRPFADIQASLQRQGQTIHALGTTSVEAGRLITQNLVGPLSVVSGLLTQIGVTNADMRIMGQMGMKAAGVSQHASAREMERLQLYAVDTPFSSDLMHEYQMKMVRGMVAREMGYDSKDPEVRQRAADRAATRTSDVIEAVLDSMARAGNLSVSQQQRSLYAIDKIMDLDRAPTRNFKQFIDATGIPAQEMAQLLNFKNADQMYKVMGTPATKGGGITGQQVLDALLENWNGSEGRPGSKGYGREVGTATITGRLQQMKERAVYEAGQLFATTDPATGEVRYTGLGEKIMGTRNTDGVYEGGLLNDAQDIAAAGLPFTQETLEGFFEVLATFTGWLKETVGFLDEHPGLRDFLIRTAQIAAVAIPFLIGFGLLAKLFGKLGRIMAPSLGLARGFVAGMAGIGKVGRQLGAGVRGAGTERGFWGSWKDKRTELRGGDDRSMPRRGFDRLRGRDVRADQITREIDDLRRQLEAADRRSDELRESLREVDRTSVRQISAALGGSGQSVSSAADHARASVRQIITQGTDPLDSASLARLHAQFRDTEQRAGGLEEATEAAGREVGRLDGRKLVALRVQVDTTEGTVQDLKNSLSTAGSAVSALNRKKTDQLQGEVTSVRGAVDQARDAVDTASRRVTALDSRALTRVRAQFRSGRASLYGAAEDVYKIIGTAASPGSISNRITHLDGRSLKSITGKMDAFGKSLKDARAEADKLNSRLDDISRQTGPGSGGGKGGSSKPKKHARGGLMGPGVLPGYKPWVDEIPAILSPGESVLRPEVTAALGADTINSWNGMAIKGQLNRKRFARGGIVERLGLNEVTDLLALQDISPQGRLAVQTMRYDATADPIGGGAKAGMLNVGDRAGQFAGTGIAEKFAGLYDWATGDMFTLLRRAPTGIGQAVGILGGSLSPIMADHFWDDVWRGEGNIVERGNRYLKNVFSVDTLTSATGNLLSGLWESVKALAGGAWDLATDPMDSVNDAVDLVWDVTSGTYNNLIGMVGTLRDVSASPLDYADRVMGSVYATARESLPNTKGLFDFSDSDKLSAQKPDMAQAIGGDINPGGDAVKRWTPLVKQVLAMLGLSQSYTDLVLHRIRVESGGNPKAKNLWDINAKNGVPSEGLMQTIPTTFHAYAGPFRSRGITDPLASIYAGLNYAVSRYGSRWPQALSGTKGYWTGTKSATAGLAMVGEHGPELVNFRGGERVYTDRQTEQLVAGRRYEVHIHEAKAEDTTQSVLRALRTAEVMAGRF
ncbi:transglycosylase SLT domain-containing protein [Streptomyces sp. NPDC000594]|uniref:transglycosylase SLT domain-containing protein n=1 Tax=Streptomyces sp. NPDC000594 TaxID=3154261 RepID=UPI0033260D98